MGNDVVCPLSTEGEPRTAVVCVGPKCGWWDAQGKCCSIKTIAEFQRLDGSRVVTAVGELNNSLDARLGDLLYKLDRLLVEPR
jgi:hypothetical protein